MLWSWNHCWLRKIPDEPYHLENMVAFSDFDPLFFEAKCTNRVFLGGRFGFFFFPARRGRGSARRQDGGGSLFNGKSQ